MQYMYLTGIVASIFTAISLLPQLIKLVREKDATNISFATLFVLFIGLGLWVCYGVLRGDWIIVVSNGFSLLVTAVVIALSFHYKNNPS